MSREEEQTCIHCGRPTRYSENFAYQCKDDCPASTPPLPTPEAPVPVSVAKAAAPKWEKELKE